MMGSATTFMAGLSFLTVPAIQYGGYFLLRSEISLNRLSES